MTSNIRVAEKELELSALCGASRKVSKKLPKEQKPPNEQKIFGKMYFQFLKKVFFSGIRGLGYNITEESIRSFV